MLSAALSERALSHDYITMSKLDLSIEIAAVNIPQIRTIALECRYHLRYTSCNMTTIKTAHNEYSSAIRQGVAAAWPICLGYIPIGLALGLLAQKAGLSSVEIGLMSLFVFAGSAQFIAVSMLSTGAGPLAIIMTTFIVNLRHLLMSSSLSLFFRNTGRAMLSFYAYGITDESFAVNQPRFKEGNWGLPQAMTVHQVSNLVWILSTVAGAYGGQFIPAHSFGMDYALIAMFICLLIFQIKGVIYIITALIAGIAAAVMSLYLPGNIHVVIAAILAATIGSQLRSLIERRTAAQPSPQETNIP